MTALPKTTPNNSPADSAWIARFERLLGRQIELCNELVRLGESQRGCIDRDDPDALLAVLTERQGVIDGLRSAAEEAKPLRERWSAGEIEADAGLLERVRSAIAELTTLMHAISESDAEDRRRLDRSRDELADRLAGVARSRGAIAAYGGSRTGAPRYQDREG